MTILATPVYLNVWDAFEALSDADGTVPVKRLAYLGVATPTRRPLTSIYYAPTNRTCVLSPADLVLVQPVRVSIGRVRDRFVELLEGADPVTVNVCEGLFSDGPVVLSGADRVVASRLLSVEIPGRIWSHSSLSGQPFA